MYREKISDRHDLLSRRSLIKGLLLTGGSILVTPACGRASNSAPGDGRFRPAYAGLEERGEFADRIDKAMEMLAPCTLCPRMCRTDRKNDEPGFCRALDRPVVASDNPHFGEELPLVGRNGSGTIFFSHCNLRCVFCQNWPIAHEGRGRTESVEDLAQRMLRLQRRGCHNINLVTPTHMMPMILQAVRVALHQGLEVPLVYNTGGYERREAIELLDGIVDIYLPDLKFMDGEESKRYTGDGDLGVEDYPKHARAAIKEMHRQVGVLRTDDSGIAMRGLMVRHLVMPNRVSSTREFVRWVADTLSTDTYVNIMAQYRVAHEAFDYPRIARSITTEEFLDAMDRAEQAGLSNLDCRSVSQRNIFRRRR